MSEIIKIFDKDSGHGWFCGGRVFEPVFLILTVATAMIACALVSYNLVPFEYALVVYGVLVAQPHFVATYTRTAFSKALLLENKFKMLVLPFLVFATLVTLHMIYGVWIYLSLYLYVQWFHFTRQSYGVSRMYRGKSKIPVTDDALTNFVIYVVPFWGIIQWSVMAPETYIGLPVKLFYIPDVLDPICGVIAVTSVVLWFYGRFKMWKRKQLPVPHTIYVITHIGMFFLCYVWIDVIEHGWMTIGIWHSSQYLLFVWAFNSAKSKKEPVKKNVANDFLSKAMSLNNIWTYLFCMAALAWAIFGSANALAAVVEGFFPIPALITVGTFMFHHYIVDAMIWRKKKAS